MPTARSSPEVIAAFAGDDPGFIQEDDGWLDVRHEAVLRQWPLISEWRNLEGESETWLHKLSEAARDYEKESDKMELWRGNDLREAEIWFAREKPLEAWAIRHSVKNWEACVRFLEISRQTALDLEEQKKQEAIKLREAKERRQNRLLTATGAIAMALFIIGLVMTNLWKNASTEQTTGGSRCASASGTRPRISWRAAKLRFPTPSNAPRNSSPLFGRQARARHRARRWPMVCLTPGPPRKAPPRRLKNWPPLVGMQSKAAARRGGRRNWFRL